MVGFYTRSTSNGRKIAIALEEMGIDYRTHPINITKSEQLAPDFTALSANARIPAIVDHAARVTLFESGAILIHLTEKTGRFLSTSGPARSTAL